MKKICFTFALKYEETFSPTKYNIIPLVNLHKNIKVKLSKNR